MSTAIVVFGGNLWALAAMHLNDATQAARIAEMNGLTDPFISGQTTLMIPDPDPSQAGGLWPHD